MNKCEIPIGGLYVADHNALRKFATRGGNARTGRLARDRWHIAVSMSAGADLMWSVNRAMSLVDQKYANRRQYRLFA